MTDKLTLPLNRPLDQHKRDIVRAQLKVSGNVSKAARVLGITRVTLAKWRGK